MRYVSDRCNIAPPEIEIASRQKQINRKLFELAAVKQLLSCVSFFICFSVLIVIFTARCYAERGYATVCRLSVHLFVCNVQVP